MNDTRIEESKSTGNPGQFRKPYKKPAKMVVLGGIDEVVRNGHSHGLDTSMGGSHTGNS